jgi:hypothetical protein
MYEAMISPQDEKEIANLISLGYSSDLAILNNFELKYGKVNIQNNEMEIHPTEVY